jgi:hypothetical protein
MRSIVSNEKVCLICGTTLNLHRHHILYGSGKRQLSEKYGCWCYLCAKHHNMSNEGVHFNKVLDNKLKGLAQKRFKEVYPQLEFIKIFGKNYLEVVNE